MALSDLIQTSTSLASASVQQANFGKPLILSNGDNKASWSGSVYREYANLAGLLADFNATSATYLQAQAIFDQSPTVPLVGVGLRATSASTQIFYLDELGASITGAGVVLTFTVNGNSFTYTTVSGDSVHDTFITNLVTALTGAAWYGTSGLTITSDSTNGATHHLVKVVCTAATLSDIVIATTMLNYLILYQCCSVSAETVAQIEAAISTDLTSIANQNNTWYTILSPYVSAVEIVGIAKYAQSNTKSFIYQTSDSNCIQIGGASDVTLAAANAAPTQPPVTATAASVMALLANAGYTRSMGIYTQTLLNFTDGAWAGDKLWTTPGSETWAYATLAGVSAAVLTETQRNNVVGTLGVPSTKYGNVYESVGGINITELGITPGENFFDTIRFLDWVNATIQTTILAAFASASASGTKIPYTQQGITFVCGLVMGVLKQGVAQGGFAAGTLSVPVPALSGISAANLNARNLPNIAWSATEAGAINTAAVQGNVTV